MGKTETRKRYRDPAAYYGPLATRRALSRLGFPSDDLPPEPEYDEIEVVEVEAVQGGEIVKVRAYADQVPVYERILEEWKSAQEENGDDE